MNNIIVRLKKTLSNKNTVTIIALVFSLALLYYVYNWRIAKATQAVVVPYATNAIGPRTYITKDMLSTKKIPGGVVNNNVLLNTNEIIGKYVNKDYVVPSNGLFYRDAIVEWKEISDTIYSDIPDGHTIVNLKVDINTTYGNSIFPGNYIDLYCSFRPKNNLIFKETNKMVIGKFIESIRVLAVVDKNGNNVFETNNVPSEPVYLVFSVDEKLHLLIKKADLLDIDVFPVPRNASYSQNPKNTRVANSQIEMYVETNAINVDVKENSNSNNGGVN